MHELTHQELDLVSGGNPLVRVFTAIKNAWKNTDPVAKSVAANGATGAVTYVASNTVAGNDMSVAGFTGATVAGMTIGRFGNGPAATILSGTTGGAAEKAVKGVNSVLKDNTNNNNTDRDSFGGN